MALGTDFKSAGQITNDLLKSKLVFDCLTWKMHSVNTQFNGINNIISFQRIIKLSHSRYYEEFSVYGNSLFCTYSTNSVFCSGLVFVWCC